MEEPLAFCLALARTRVAGNAALTPPPLRFPPGPLGWSFSWPREVLIPALGYAIQTVGVCPTSAGVPLVFGADGGIRDPRRGCWGPAG